MGFEQKEIVITDFSGIYQQESFYKGRKTAWFDLQNISGTNCYCDDQAKKMILERIKDISPRGIHFIDSGNYHYMSRIWIEKIHEPFRLLVFDNHTDMQPPAFGGILSCGGWISASLDENPFLKEVILVGPSKEDFQKVDDQYKTKVTFFSREALGHEKGEKTKEFFESILLDVPLYISVDKDILNPEDVETSWSQGDMSLRELLQYLKIVFRRLEEEKKILMGIDICGESDHKGIQKNDHANKKILELFCEFFENEECDNQDKDGICYEG